jgi:ribosomal protein L29
MSLSKADEEIGNNKDETRRDIAQIETAHTSQ